MLSGRRIGRRWIWQPLEDARKLWKCSLPTVPMPTPTRPECRHFSERVRNEACRLLELYLQWHHLTQKRIVRILLAHTSEKPTGHLEGEGIGGGGDRTEHRGIELESAEQLERIAYRVP